MGLSFLEHFRSLPDYRIPGLETYPLDEILLATLVGVLCRMEDWEEITLFAGAHLDWLRRYLPYAQGVPSEQTLRAVFRGLDSEQFSRCFASWVTSLAGHIKGVVAIDGKTLRGSKREAGGAGALHMLCAYAHAAGLVIGGQRVDGKSNEITAIPELLDMLALKGAIVTIDAMGTQKDIAAKIVEQEADYVLALKGNQSALHNDVRLFFEENSREVQWQTHETTDGGHGRIETRHCTATADIDWLRERHPDWTGLHSIVQVQAMRIDKKSTTTV
jgi:predicted transposase YbfD/YdcC